VATFGTLVDGDTTEPGNTDRCFLGLYTLTEAGTVTAINVRYAADTGTENAKALIYTDSSGTPGTLVAVSSSVVVTGGDQAHTISASLSAGNYWIGSVLDSFQYGWRYLGGGAGSACLSDTSSYASPPSTFTGASISANLVSVYATYSPANAPTITTQPTNTGVLEDQVAVFTVAGTASAGSLTYQWQDNRTGSMANIPDGSGTTSTIYVTSACRLQQTGRQVQCVLTDSNGSTTSNVVTLLVGRYPDLASAFRHKRQGGLLMGIDIKEWW
jgi:hypothetical protein